MSLDEIDREILTVLSKQGGNYTTLSEIMQESNTLTKSSIELVLGRLVILQDRGLVDGERVSVDPYFRITAKGLDLIKQEPTVEEARKILLCELYKQYFIDPNSKLTHKKLSGLTGLPEGTVLALLFDWANQKLVAGYSYRENGNDIGIWRIEHAGITEYETKYLDAKQLEKIEIKNPLIKHKFRDEFYQKLIDEINRAYHFELYVATWVLVRKLFENLIITLLRAKYQLPNYDLYYYKNDGRFHEFSILIKNLKKSVDDFKLYTTQLDEPFFTFLEQFREKANSNAHSIDVVNTKDEINKLIDKINGYCDLLASVYKNITNNPL